MMFLTKLTNKGKLVTRDEDSLHLSSTRLERRLCINHTILRRKYSRAGFTRGYSLGEEAGWREGFLFGLKKGGKFLVNQVFSLPDDEGDDFDADDQVSRS